MKKIIIVNNNMAVGGVQKSLYNLLWSIDTEHRYDVTLLLFSKSGAYSENLPKNVKIEESGGLFRYFGKNQSDFRSSLKDTAVRGFLAALSRTAGRDHAVRLMLKKQPVLNDEFDCAISYLHNGREKSFYGGVQDYVLNCTRAKRKIAFLHCDYRNCGADHPSNNRMMARFDRIAACSDGCRRIFESVLPELKEKCVTVQNCHRFDEIRALAEEDPLIYDSSFVNVVMTARLTHEKGIERAIKAAAEAVKNGHKLKLHIVGGGAMYDELVNLARRMAMSEHTVFYGEQSNPYRYMKNVDLFLVSSYHEAAPMVIDEARSLSLPILTTKTSSAEDMVSGRGCGWVCENSQEALDEALIQITRDKEILTSMKNKLQNMRADNSTATAQFDALLDG
ncbi:MAG: glycosyltransferase [Clostridia bacterium]|nr:glycosyltransferase [Clostridia bacterium]